MRLRVKSDQNDYVSKRDIVNASLLYSLGERYKTENDTSVAFSIDTVLMIAQW